jgi:hypothetical protein
MWWWPPISTQDDFRGVEVVASAFLVASVLILCGGAAAVFEEIVRFRRDGVSGDTVSIAVASTVVGALITASLMAFLGYVLQLLRALHFDVRLTEIRNEERENSARENSA